MSTPKPISASMAPSSEGVLNVLLAFSLALPPRARMTSPTAATSSSRSPSTTSSENRLRRNRTMARTSYSFPLAS